MNYSIVREIKPNIHDRSTIYMIESNPNQSLEDLPTGLVELLGTYPTQQEASDKMDELQDIRVREYTKYINNTGFPPDVKPFNSRYITAYIGSDLTTNPGLYHIDLYDFFSLRNKYPSVRIATNQELEINQVIPGLRVRDSEIDNFNNLGLTQTVTYREGYTDDDIRVSNDEIQRMATQVFNYINILNVSDREGRKSILREIHPNSPDTEIDSIYESILETFGPLKFETDKMRDAGAPPEEIVSYVIKYMQSLNLQ